jgi:predicted Ser/Thr protein kinase
VLKAKPRAWYLLNKHKILEKKRSQFQEDRLKFIQEAGGKCVLCGERDPHVLDFDHIDNDGAAWRKTHNVKNFVQYLKKHGLDRSKIQLLCKNCNWRKERIRRLKDATKEPTE